MATEFYFYCYPWDLEDEGCDIATTRLAGEIGVDGINVVAAHLAITAFRPRASFKPRTRRLTGGVAFQPDAKRYANSHLRPINSDWIKSRNPLAKIAEAAGQHELKLRLTVECCANATLAEKFGMAAGVDAFGEALPPRLCPSNPDVQAYVAAMIEDLCINYQPDSIELRSADFGSGLHPNDQAAPLSEPARYCLSLCFCASCRRTAMECGVDDDEAAEQARSVIDDWDVAREQWTIGDLLSENETLAAYQDARSRTITELCAAARHKADEVVLIAPICDDAFRAQPAKSLSEILDGHLCEHQVQLPGVAPIRCDAETAFDPSRKHIRIHASRRMVHDGPHLVAEVRRLIESKIASISFENYGLLPEHCLEWVRQAIRFAKREAGG